MKPIFILAMAALFTVGCQKQESEAERNAEVERQVQQRLAAEKQAEEQQRITQGQVDLSQRVEDLEKQPAASAAPVETEPEREQASGQPDYDQDEESDTQATGDYSTFFSHLDSEGDWIETSNYGYVWQPRVARQSHSWRPYTLGRWVYTDAGWTWISEEPFGWATYHYGRWTRLRNVGWIWVPGNQWAPAWVSWRSNNDYVGWAPLPPEARFDRGSGIHNWADNYYDIGPDQYSFVQTSSLGEQNLAPAIVPPERNMAIVNQTVNVTNITYNNAKVMNNGPRYEDVRSRSQRPIERLRLERQVSVNTHAGDLHAVVRGDVVQIPGPVIARAQSVERPRTVRENIAQVVVDHGWEAGADRQAAEKTRAKMRGEATPPPNAPSRTFVRPQAAPAARTAAPVASASPHASVSRPLTTPAISVTATPTPLITPRATSTPQVQATAASKPASSTPPKTRATPVPRAPEVTMTPAPSATPLRRPSVLPAPPRSEMAPAASPEASSSITPAEASSAAPPSGRFNRPVQKGPEVNRERQLRRPQNGPAITPTPSAGTPIPEVASGSATPDGASSPAASQWQQNRAERSSRRPGRVPERPSPSPSVTP
jgi:uncharacterized protein DUF6600